AYLMPLPLESPYKYSRRILHRQPGDGYKLISGLKRTGLVTVYEKNNQKFIKLTQKGQMRVLVQKAAWDRREKWDGKWRLATFDIPEGSRKARSELRALLKKIGFIKLQASVFISPYPLNREAVEYLKFSGLIEYIRLMRVDEIDD